MTEMAGTGPATLGKAADIGGVTIADGATRNAGA